MRRAFLALLLLVSASPAAPGDASRGRRPRLDIRLSPRVAFSPVSVSVVAELNGGDDLEEYYCPTLDWEWGDGGRSEYEADCAPFDAKDAKEAFERRFFARHDYRTAGEYSVKLTLRRSQRAIAAATTNITVHPAYGAR
jgi:hypothetical protein